MGFLPYPSDAELSAEAARLAARLLEDEGELSPVDRALLADPAAFAAYEGWRALREELVPFLGERVVTLFCLAVASSASPLCAAEFRRAVVDGGDDPDEPQVTEAERLVLDWGRALGRDAGAIPEELSTRLQQTFQPRLRVLLTAFAGLLLARCAFASAGRLGPEG